MSSQEPVSRRRKLFDKHLLGLELGETEIDHVKSKLGAPARTLREERVTVLEYDAPKEQSIAVWKKVQFIFFDDLLLNVTYAEPAAELTRAALHKVLGQPDDTPEEDESDEEGPSDIFEVELEEEPLLSFVAHYDDQENVEALSLCADMSEDMLDDGDEDLDDEADDADADDADDADAEADDDDDDDDDADDEPDEGSGDAPPPPKGPKKGPK